MSSMFFTILFCFQSVTGSVGEEALDTSLNAWGRRNELLRTLFRRNEVRADRGKV